MTKPLHVGHTARNGLFAALLAREGFTANDAALEHKQGFLRVFNGIGNFDADAILADWGRPYDIVSPGIGIKTHPCCGSTHPAVDAMLALAPKHASCRTRWRASSSWTHPRRLAHTDRPDPQTGLDAKFSVQYCLARALLGGRIVLEDFEGEAFRDPTARTLMRRIHAAPFPATPEGDGEPLGAELRITFDDGGTVAKRVSSALGRGTGNPLPEEKLHGKFANCAGRALRRLTSNGCGRRCRGSTRSAACAISSRQWRRLPVADRRMPIRTAQRSSAAPCRCCMAPRSQRHRRRCPARNSPRRRCPDRRRASPRGP